MNSAVIAKARFSDLCAAEWIKLRSLPSTYVVLALCAILPLAAAAYDGWHLRLNQQGWSYFSAVGQPFDDDAWGMLVSCVGCFGAWTIVGEHNSGLLRTSLLAVPDRGRLVAAKAAVLAAVMTVFGAVVALASYLVGEGFLASKHHGAPLSAHGAVPAIIASALVLPVATLVGMGVGAIVRNTVGALLAVYFLLTELPNLMRFGGVLGFFTESMPRHAWLAMIPQWSDAPSATGWVPGPTGAWISFAAWLVIGVVVALVAMQRRDV
jgi:ABC-2 type transport system permease protein